MFDARQIVVYHGADYGDVKTMLEVIHNHKDACEDATQEPGRLVTMLLTGETEARGQEREK